MSSPTPLEIMEQMPNELGAILGNIETSCDGKSSEKNAVADLIGRIGKFAADQGISREAALFRLVLMGMESCEKQCGEAVNTKFSQLSGRQNSVLNALRAGAAVKEVADQLNISEATVRTHIQRIRERLNCSDLLRLRLPGLR